MAPIGGAVQRAVWFVAAFCTATLSLAWDADTAEATDAGDAAQAAAVDAAVDAVVDDAPVAVSASATRDGALVALDDSTVVEVPVDASDGIDIAGPNGVEIALGLPGADDADPGRVTGAGTVTYTDVAPSASVVVQPLVDGGARALIAIEGPAAPTEYAFPMELPDGVSLEMQADGSVNIIAADGVPVGSFAAPWATDSTGAPVPTAYRLDGDTLVQEVLHVGNYPVVADPRFTWGWITGTAYYNRAETRLMKTWWYVGIVASGLCAAFVWETAGAACAISGALLAQWQYVATNAYADGGCVKIKIPYFWAYAYSGGYCQ